jgi:hypothetical protein
MNNKNARVWALVAVLSLALVWTSVRGQSQSQSFDCTITWRADGGFDQSCTPVELPPPASETPETGTPVPSPTNIDTATEPPASPASPTATDVPAATSTATTFPTAQPTASATPYAGDSPTPVATLLPPTPTPVAGETTVLAYTIDRSAVPALYYTALTLVVDIGVGNSAVVTGDGQVSYRLDEERGVTVVTTEGNHFQVEVSGSEPVPGSVTPALLKEEKAWAWSIGLDDNTYQKEGIALMRQAGYRGTLFPIADRIHDTRNEGWIMDAPYMRELIAAGWSIGNHTWDHNCNAATISDATVIAAYERLRGIVDAAGLADYRMIAFAAPCFASAYNPIIEGMAANGDYEVLYNESGPGYLLDVAPGAPDVVYRDGRSIVGWNPARRIGRDGNSNESRLATMDWVAANATRERPLWYNVLVHSLSAATIQPYLDRLAQHDDSVWAAPSDEIYSYLLLRERAAVTQDGGG